MDVQLKATGTPAQVAEDLSKQVKALRDQAERDGPSGTWKVLAPLRDWAREDLKTQQGTRTITLPDGTTKIVPAEYDVVFEIKWTVTPVENPDAAPVATTSRTGKRTPDSSTAPSSPPVPL